MINNPLTIEVLESLNAMDDFDDTVSIVEDFGALDNMLEDQSPAEIMDSLFPTELNRQTIDYLNSK